MAALANGHQDEGRPNGFELAASSEATRELRAAEPGGVVDLDRAVNGSRDALTMARRTLWSISHAVSATDLSWRCRPSAETPRVSVVIRYAAQNH